MYVPLPGVGALESSCISCQFGKRSYDFQVSNLDGRNYGMVVETNKEIDASGSKYLQKADKCVIKLRKVKSETWDKLQRDKRKEERDRQRDQDTKEDPSGSIMKLMKDMYDDGDDDMKRTIAKAWTESREKKGGAGLDSGLGDL